MFVFQGAKANNLAWWYQALTSSGQFPKINLSDIRSEIINKSKTRHEIETKLVRNRYERWRHLTLDEILLLPSVFLCIFSTIFGISIGGGLACAAAQGEDLSVIIGTSVATAGCGFVASMSLISTTIFAFRHFFHKVSKEEKERLLKRLEDNMKQDIIFATRAGRNDIRAALENLVYR